MATVSQLEPYLDKLPVEQRRALCDNRITGYQNDLYGHLLNRAALTALPDSDASKEQALANAEAAIKTLTNSIDAVRTFREQLGASPTPTTPAPTS